MGEVIPKSFGEQINYDDTSDPDVAHVKLWEHSPSRYYAGEYRRARETQAPRRYFEDLFEEWDDLPLRDRPSPHTGAYVHERWLMAIKYDPKTFELLEDAPPELLDELRSMPILGENTGAPFTDAERWAYQPKYVPPQTIQETRGRIGEMLEQRSSQDSGGKLLPFVRPEKKREMRSDEL